MKILVTGFNGKIGYEVAKNLKNINTVEFVCAVRDVEKAEVKYSNEYNFVQLDFTNTDTFDKALKDIDKIFLIYPPGEDIKFKEFLLKAKEKKIKHIVYLSLKDVQFMPFIHHFKNEKLIKKLGFHFTFIRAGYFMQNLNDFLRKEIKERRRIFVPAGKGKTSFVDARDIAEISVISLLGTEEHKNKVYVITGNAALDFYEVAKIMTEVLNINIEYTNPSVKEFKDYMLKNGEDEGFVNVVVGVHFPTKLGLAKGIKYDFEKVTKRKPIQIRKYIKDYKEYWL